MRSSIYGIICIFGVFFCILKDAADCEYMDSSFQRSTPQGKRLTGITVKRVNVKNEMACARECLNLASCFSVNLGPPLTPGDTGLNCELNLDTALGSGKELQNHPDYTYFERESLAHTIRDGAWVDSAAYSDSYGWLFITTSHYIYWFPDTSMTSQATGFDIGLEVKGLNLKLVTGNDLVNFTIYLSNDTVVEATLNLTTKYLEMEPNSAQPLQTIYGPLAPSSVDDVITINNTNYLFLDDVIYFTDGESQLVNGSFYMNDPIGQSSFLKNAPTGISAATAIQPPYLLFFKDKRFYKYDMDTDALVHMGTISGLAT